MINYRRKIYKYYSTNRIGKLAPATVEGFKGRAPYLKKIIKEHFPANKNISILELGCGHGAFQYFIAKAGYINSYGIDGSEEQVQEAHRLGISNVIEEDIIGYINKTQDKSIDLLIAFDVVEHFTKEELSDLVDNFFRVLKKGGKIICHIPNGEGPFGYFIRTGDFTHEMAFTRQSIAQLFLSSGFGEVKSYEDKPIPHGVKSSIRYLLWEFLIRNMYRFIVAVETGNADGNAIYSQNFLVVVQK